MNKPEKPSIVQDYFATKEAQELKKSIEKNRKANAHHEKAIGILKEAILLGASDPAMTPEVKELADMIVFLIEDRNLHDYTFDGIMEPLAKIVEKDTRSQSGKNAIDMRHNKPGGARKKKEAIRAVWAEGKYLTHKDCAQNESDKFGYSYDGALKALRNAKVPSPWPAKEAKASRAKK